jgi:hypothetical protein
LASANRNVWDGPTWLNWRQNILIVAPKLGRMSIKTPVKIRLFNRLFAERFLAMGSSGQIPLPHRTVLADGGSFDLVLESVDYRQ